MTKTQNSGNFFRNLRNFLTKNNKFCKKNNKIRQICSKTKKKYLKLKVKSPKTSNFRQIHYPTFAGKTSKKQACFRGQKESDIFSAIGTDNEAQGQSAKLVDANGVIL